MKNEKTIEVSKKNAPIGKAEGRKNTPIKNVIFPKSK
tara:strand:- start:203 stop:313 length:111 start_codon:yes stop_codon:yes gene_type:complete